MSEYQYYEFLAVDRPLTAGEQAEVREFSTRARITATSFHNEYHWGDFRGDPGDLMGRYYDAHLYLANWGTHRIMLRLPRTLLDPEEKARLLLLVAQDQGARATMELLHRFRADTDSGGSRPRRRVGTLLDAAALHRKWVPSAPALRR